jgi:hypothetical protein
VFFVESEDVKMWQRKALLPLIGLFMSFGLYLSISSFTPALHAQAKGDFIVYGQTVHGEVEDRFGDEWLFFGWAGETITITYSSSEFDTYLELYGPQHRRWYRRNNNFEGMGTNSALNHYKLPLSGYYTIVAAPNDTDATGAYTLTLNAPTTATLALNNGTSTTAAQESASSGISPGEPTCIVISSALNLRSGPSVDYNPPLRSLARNARFRPNSRNEAGTWIEVTDNDSLDHGWVRASANFIDCTSATMTLPVNTVAVTPTTP